MIILPFFTALRDLIDLCDAQIITREGAEVLADPEKMKQVHKAIRETKRGSVVVRFEKNLS